MAAFKRANKPAYASFAQDGSFIPPTQAAEQGSCKGEESGADSRAAQDACDVAYTFESLAWRFPGEFALVLARGKTARRVFQNAADAGLQTCAVFTTDRKSDSTSKFATKTVCIGKTYSEQLFRNAHAVLIAAQEASSRSILLCDESEVLASDEAFLATAQSLGMRVFKPLPSAAFGLGWVLCEAPSDAQPVEEWQVCKACGLSHSAASVEAGGFTCPDCGAYFRMSAPQRIEATFDANSFEEWFCGLTQTDPLQFPGYTEKLAKLNEATGLDEAVVTGRAALAGINVAVAVMDSRFLMGSMGSVVGEKLCLMIDRAIEQRLPVVIFCTSGGARMQEGLTSLMQMAKISCALERLGKAGLPYISVLTDPTTGGVTASFAMQGDVILAEPKALIGFAGQRVIRDTIKQELPEGFQTAEFALEHGLIDAIVPRENMREALAHVIALHAASTCNAEPNEGECGSLISYAQVCASLVNNVAQRNSVVIEPLRMANVLASEPEQRRTILQKLFKRGEGDGGSKLKRMLDYGATDADLGQQDAMPAGSTPRSFAGETSAWDSVQLARNVRRPTAVTYIDGLVDGFIELHGDRMFADDGAIVGGIGWIGGRPVTVIAQEKGANLQERIKRNFGCPQPEGYRKSLRFMRQAEKFGRPIVCLVDTQGAFCGTEAEERGQGNAIADNLIAMAGLRVPVVSVLLGEGGSGGALALAASNRVAMQENAVYSVLSPEGFASILWKDRTRAAEAAAVMKMDAASVLDMGVVDAVIPEGEGPAHENPDQAVESVKAYVTEALRELDTITPEELIAQRHARFARF